MGLARDYFLETIHRTLSLFFSISIYLSLNFSPRYSASVINFFIFLSLPFSISLFLYFATFVTRVWILLSHLECPIAFLISSRRCRYTALSALCSPSFFPRYDKFFSLCLSFSPSYAIALARPTVYERGINLSVRPISRYRVLKAVAI